MNKNLEMGIIKSIPKKWSKEEEEYLLEEKKKWYNNKHIAELLWRTEVSISIKYKRIHKKDDTYNKKHILEKYAANNNFIDFINPNTLLDAYAWNRYYKDFWFKKYVTNDKDKTKKTDYSLEAFQFMSNFYNKKFDIVDLDPFGSAFDCFDLAIKIASKGLIITLWEVGHKRFKRLDFVNSRYWITSIEDDWESKIIDYIIQRGKIYKKNIKVYSIKKFNRISRVYLEVNSFKEMSQWNNKKYLKWKTN